jgi:hypothetical protein
VTARSTAVIISLIPLVSPLETVHFPPDLAGANAFPIE